MFDVYWRIVLGLIVLLPLVGSGIFSVWIRRQAQVDGELATKYWDVFIKLVSALTIIIAGAFAYVKYLDERISTQNNEEEQRLREVELREAEILSSQKEFEVARLELHRKFLAEAKTTAASLAWKPSGDAQRRSRFEELYYADLIGIENKEVSSAMVAFRQEMVMAENSKTESKSLHTLALRLSKAVEAQIHDEEAVVRDLSLKIASHLPIHN